MKKSRLPPAPAVHQKSPHRSFRHRPSNIVIQAFLDHIRATGRPETFDGLFWGKIDKEAGFIKLKPFDIERGLRPLGDKVPCPMCQPNKFLEGSLIWVPSLQVMAVIGHCCASAESRARAHEEYERMRIRDEDETYLMAELPLVLSRLGVIEQVRPTALEARRVYRRLRTKGNPIHRALRSIKQQQGGRLSVSERIHREPGWEGPRGLRTRDGDIDVREIEFGTMEGMGALIGDYDPVRELDEIERRLTPHARPATEAAALEYAIELGESGRRRRAVVDLREADRTYGKFVARLHDFRAFFSASNFRRLKEWADHPLNLRRLQVLRSARAGIVTCAMWSDGYYFTVDIDPIMSAELPEWPRADVSSEHEIQDAVLSPARAS